MDEATRRDLRKIKSRKMKDPQRALEILRAAADQISEEAERAREDRFLYCAARDSLIAGKKVEFGMRLS